ncbi:hypothetical protein [Streptomyces sp. JNUCC 63]
MNHPHQIEDHALIGDMQSTDALAPIGRLDGTQTLFEHLLALRNDVGLPTEYEPVAGRRPESFPQAFSRNGLITSVLSLNRLVSSPPHGSNTAVAPHHCFDGCVGIGAAGAAPILARA